MTYPPLDEQQCGNCRYWRRHWNLKEDGFCRRHAPTAVQVSDKGYGSFRDEAHMTVWPESSIDEWCGEWGPRE